MKLKQGGYIVEEKMKSWISAQEQSEDDATLINKDMGHKTGPRWRYRPTISNAAK